jgi:hypothetical protein
VRRQSGIFKAVVDDSKEAFYTSKLKQRSLFPSSSEEESNDGGMVSCLVGDVKQIAKKRDGKRKAISLLREEQKRRKEDKNDLTYVPEDTGKKNRNKKSDTASNKKSAGDCVFDVSFVFLFFSISSLMNSSNI